MIDGLKHKLYFYNLTMREFDEEQLNQSVLRKIAKRQSKRHITKTQSSYVNVLSLGNSKRGKLMHLKTVAQI